MERRFDNRRNNSGGRSNFGGRGNFDGRPQQKHKAICSACKKECEVPFKPTEGREVFCHECFKKRAA